MEQTIIEVLKAQRNDAMDTIAVLNAHLVAARQENAGLKAAMEQRPTDAESAASSYDAAKI